MLYLSPKFFKCLLLTIGLFLAAWPIPIFLIVAQASLLLLVVFTLAEIGLLFYLKSGITANRLTPNKLSNGDENPLQIDISNHYPFKAQLEIIDELPFQFQKRDAQYHFALPAADNHTIYYKLRPTERGEYHFGKLRVFVSTFIALVQRRYSFPEEKLVKVYPSFIQMQKFAFLAISNQLQTQGIKKIRRIGQSMEFEQIRNYIQGDDYRTINWKASARRHQLMVNQYQDDRSQAVYMLVDKGRVMKMPFNGLSLLDYAINTSLVMSNIAILKGDRAGLVTFSNKVDSIQAAVNKSSQVNVIQEVLYKEKSDFLESNYQALYQQIRQKITRRSLLLLFSNFESLVDLQRQLPFLRKLAKRHLLVVIFFENTELTQLNQQAATNVREVYIKTIGQKFAFEKKRIVMELRQYGIHTIVTPPEQLTIQTINKYLELKQRGL